MLAPRLPGRLPPPRRSRTRPPRPPLRPARPGGAAGGRPRLPPGLVLRRRWNTVNLSTALGMALAHAAGCAVRPGPDGLLLAPGYRWTFPAGGAFTVGNVVLLRPETRPTARLLAHESRHATQYAWCAGLPFLPLYLLGVGWSLLRTGDTASRNPFERHAGLSAGGYRERAVRWPVRRR